jgi:hypothetical protein
MFPSRSIPARRLVLIVLVAVPALGGVAVAGAELARQGVVQWTVGAHREHARMCAADPPPPSVECGDDEDG